MTLLKYTAIPTDASWDQITYHEIVKVVKGYARVENPLTIEALRYRGFELVTEDEHTPDEHPLSLDDALYVLVN